MVSTLTEQQRQYAKIAQAIDYIRANARQQPSLADIAAAVDLSSYHLQRLFTEWAGISPKRFLQYLTKERAKFALRDAGDVLDTSLGVGLSGPGRLHDLMISCEAMTPGEIRQGGAGIELRYGAADTPFGSALIGQTARGVCSLAFCDGDIAPLEQELADQWPNARLSRDDAEADALAQRIFLPTANDTRLRLLLRGTNFQIKVWEALLNIGSARLLTYGALARLVDAPKAARAVGSALAANEIGYLIPCHRVIRDSGEASIYRWGGTRKIAMQAWEATTYDAPQGNRPRNPEATQHESQTLD